MTRPRLSLLAISALWLSCGCSSKAVTPGSDTADGGANGNGGAASGGQPPVVKTCPPGPNIKTDPEPVTVGFVSGSIVDENGDPTSAGLVQVCGKNLCLPAHVGDDGALGEAFNQPLTAPLCKYGDGFDWGKLGVPVAAGDSQLGTLMTVRLPDYAGAPPFEPGKSISSGGVTLALDAGSGFVFDGLDYSDDQLLFRAAALPAAALPPLGHDFVAGYALSPLETHICPLPAISIENTSDLPAGTALELYVLGLDVDEKWVPYGAWQLASSGQVSADGATLEFPDGAPVLSAFAVRVKD